MGNGRWVNSRRNRTSSCFPVTASRPYKEIARPDLPRTSNSMGPHVPQRINTPAGSVSISSRSLCRAASTPNGRPHTGHRQSARRSTVLCMCTAIAHRYTRYSTGRARTETLCTVHRVETDLEVHTGHLSLADVLDGQAVESVLMIEPIALELNHAREPEVNQNVVAQYEIATRVSVTGNLKGMNHRFDGRSGTECRRLAVQVIPQDLSVVKRWPAPEDRGELLVVHNTRMCVHDAHSIVLSIERHRRSNAGDNRQIHRGTLGR